jgi:hypothetical protein
MKRVVAMFLQMVLVLMAIGVLTLLLWEPHLEGRNVSATLFQIYFNDPFLAYIYVAFIPFFIGIWQAIILSGFLGQNKIFSPASMKALQTIKLCALVTAGFIVGAEAWLFIFERGKDDIAGGVAMGLLIIFLSLIVATAAVVFERILRKALPT